MIKIGITGGIGSGKSMVAALLEVWGIPVYIADTESKHLTATSPVIREKLITLFGKELYTADGLDKRRLASHIFGIVDTTLMVYAPMEIRIGRILERDSVSREEIIRRIESQLPDEMKKEKSDYVIFNDGEQALLPQITAFLAGLKIKKH